MSEAVSRPDDGGKFVSLWELFRQIGQAEREHENDVARSLGSSLENDPTGINYIRRRDESGIILPLDMGARLHLLQQLNVFARQGTLFDADDMPNDEAQPTFERFGFYASDIYPFLARNDVAVSRPGDEGSEGRVFPDGRRIPSWILAYDGQAWLSRSRAAKILIAGTKDADLWPPHYDDVFFKWDEALTDAIDRDAIAVTKVARKQMLSHADISAWCLQHGYVWPLEAPDAQPAGKPDTTPLSGQQIQPADSAPRNPREHDGGTTKREQQIRAIEEMADKLGYPRQQIPNNGGKKALRNLCKSEHPDLFGGGDSPFDDAWKAASKSNRLVIANRNKFAGR
ncbi:hypothetical protein [Burkholderia cepacia]|uniref:hypothetical protein n=1 Tax=Burkholderia cepacia TaxID=292 RepID=UPI001CF2CFFF|nr:hypothetical protein [Burkholderia cepacia]MCA8137308.1 hypothetical protein [Burkholderia cepacia]